MRRAKSAAGGVRSAHVRAKNASSTSVGDNGATEAPMTEAQLNMLPRVDIQHLMLRGSEIQGWGLFKQASRQRMRSLSIMENICVTRLQI